jgi:hypothetical protein
MKQTHCYLRIVFSAFCGVVCVLLIVLWVRSYRFDKATMLHGEKVQRLLNSQNRSFTAWSKLGAIHLCISRPPILGTAWETHYAAGRLLGFGLLVDGKSFALRIPYWFTVAGTCSVAIFPWTRFFSWKFSLRTLLIATTLVAVVLGLIMWVLHYAPDVGPEAEKTPKQRIPTLILDHEPTMKTRIKNPY